MFDVEETDDPAYALHSTHTYEVASCLQEMAENGYDAGHFEAVHSHPRAGVIEEVSLTGSNGSCAHARSSRPSRASPGLGASTSSAGARASRSPATRARSPPPSSGRRRPIDDEHVQLWFHFYLKDPDDERAARVAEAFVSSVSREVTQDIPIWERKRYVPRPQLAPGEAPILEFRRWFSQFYADELA